MPGHLNGLAGRRRCRHRYRVGLRHCRGSGRRRQSGRKACLGGLVAVIVSIYIGVRHPLWLYWGFAVAMGRAAVTAEFGDVLDTPSTHKLHHFGAVVEPDPQNRWQWRYFDGTTWAGHTATR
jgi:hypothetical protein